MLLLMKARRHRLVMTLQGRTDVGSSRVCEAIVVSSLLATVLVLASGCNRNEPAAMAVNVVAAPVYELADAADRPQRFRSLFVAGALPSDEQRKRLGQLSLQVSEVTSVSDAQATLHVLVDDEKGDRVGEV